MKNQSPLLAIALHIAVVPSIVAAGLGAAAAENPEDRAPMPLEATLKIYAARKAQNPISPHITGKFCEHLFFNITNGMDAQILRNPTLCDYPFRSEQMSPNGLATFMHDRDEIAGRIRNGAPRWGWPRSEIDNLVKHRLEGMAPWWTKLGPVDASPDTGPYGHRAQRIAAESAEAGIAQWTWLPLHRVREYEFAVWLRSPDLNAVEILLFEPDGKRPCARAVIDTVDGRWRRFTGGLRVPRDLPADRAYKFAVRMLDQGQLIIDRISLWPADHINRADPDVVRLLRDSSLSILRWPGGNFVSTYHWKDGVGPIEQRPTLPNYAWGRQENNLFGTDEFIAFCRAVGCEPMICINAGSGTPSEAADWIEYCNGSVDTPMGALRAANGRPAPYNVRRWEIGNELWGRWQYRWTTPAGYVDRYRRFSRVMLAADPNIIIYACGAPVMWGQEWNRRLIAGTADCMSRTTDHPLVGGSVPADTDPLDVYRDFMAVPQVLEDKWANLQLQMRAAGIEKPRLAVTELQMFARLGKPSRPDAAAALTHANLVSPDTQAEAMYDVLVYHAAVRLAPFVEMVTHSATVNHGGGLRKSRERVYANPCYYARTMFARFAHAVPLQIEIDAPYEYAPAVLPDLRRVADTQKYPVIDALAAISSADRLLISVVQRGTGGDVRLRIDLDDFDPADKATVHTLVADVPWAANSLDAPRTIVPVATTVRITDGMLRLDLKPYSLTCIEVPGES